ncbi:uncharacterized protein GGS22DRAFT_183061 [Annulohypoxylon maeteangense]|uniref:uncharacterized protein n=1 Tax=Annulohypoxylon maeteangense TaxID=1927788 RepID=UPI0020074348|nr:uncharacterized protein GGS22DRAFT_183061 [Annulohypoxylon maeteangense]KAI0889718.1 hypothetical protein GGS22DRAFT_183061 [Annulohypoxylon maeteangense]
MSTTASICVIALFIILFSYRKFKSHPQTTPLSSRTSKIEHVRSLASRNTVAASFAYMIERDGAGDWPPRANHDSWPEALLPYKTIFLELAPWLATATPSLDDAVNTERRERYRGTMKKLLQDRVRLESVMKILEDVEADNWELVTRDVLNAFYCCISLCRHAYRWATLPVVKVAQAEDVVDLPPELELPFPYLQRYYGLISDSGNHTSNVLLNFNERGERVFKFTIALPPQIQSTEEAFFKLLYDVEVMGFDIYYNITLALVSFENGRKDACLESLRNINSALRTLIQLFFQQMKEVHISRKIWLNYVQGFHGWGVGRMINNEFVRFNGVSGNHILVFQALDAFLGMERYLPDEDMERYIPASQQSLCTTIKTHPARQSLRNDEDPMLRGELDALVNQIKQYRAAHRGRVMPYLKNPAPERHPMTAGKSVLTTDPNMTIDRALEPLDQMMISRINQTV